MDNIEEIHKRNVQKRFDIIKKETGRYDTMINTWCLCPECNGGIDFRKEPHFSMLEKYPEKENG